MSVKKIAAIAVIFVGVSISWAILGLVTYLRTTESKENLTEEVVSLYGGALSIDSPLCYEKQSYYKEKEEIVEKNYYEIISSDIVVDLKLDQRKKGNLWFPTFQTNFTGEYSFKIEDYNPQLKYYLYTTLKSKDSIYRDIELTINGQLEDNIIPLVRKQAIRVYPNQDNIVTLKITYSCSGMEEFSYYISSNRNDISEINDFNLVINTDFEDFDFPISMMSPLNTLKTEEGYQLTWSLQNAVTGKDIGLIIPNKLNPGEIATRITFFAPISLFFFYLVLFIMGVVYKRPFHPMHFFFLAATFFSFHLMYSYFSDHLNPYLTFGISSLISLVLTITYLRLFADKLTAFIFAPLAQLVYLLVFSFSFFFDGLSGLIVTVCAVVTLFFLMQMTGKVDWDKLFKENK